MTVDVDTLIHDHKKAVHTVDGLEFHEAPSLLAQLRDAVFETASVDGAASGGKTRAPFQVAAFELYYRIDREVRAAWRQAFQRTPTDGRTERLLAEWAAFRDPADLVILDGRQVYAQDVAEGWVRLIEAYFNPPRLAEIEAPCIACGATRVWRDVDGETVSSTALKFLRDRDTGETLDAHCEVCGRMWSPLEFRYLAEQIDKAQKLKEAADEAANDTDVISK